MKYILIALAILSSSEVLADKYSTKKEVAQQLAKASLEAVRITLLPSGEIKLLLPTLMMDYVGYYFEAGARYGNDFPWAESANAICHHLGRKSGKVLDAANAVTFAHDRIVYAQYSYGDFRYTMSTMKNYLVIVEMTCSHLDHLEY